MQEELRSTLSTAQKYIHKAIKLFVIFLLSSMVCMVSGSVFMHYILNIGFKWTEDIVTILLSYLIFFSIPLAFRSGSHIKI